MSRQEEDAVPWYDYKQRIRVQMDSLKQRLLSHPLFDELNTGYDGSSNKESGPSSIPPPSLIHSIESHLIHLQSILLWDDPSKSLFSFGCFTLGYWFLVAWTRSIFSLICSFIFFVKLYSLWTHYVWPEIRVPPTEDQREREDWIPVHPQALSAPEIKRFMDQAKDVTCSFVTCLLNFRKHNHGLFCLVMSTSFVVIGFLGQTISGALVVYLTMMTIALAPGLFLHVLPSGFVPMVKSFFPVCPCDDGTDVFAEDDHDCKSKDVSSCGQQQQSSSFPLPMLFDLISNPSSDLLSNDTVEETLLQKPIDPEVVPKVECSNEVSVAQESEFPDSSFIRRAISSAISFGTGSSRGSSINGNSPKGDGDRSPGGNSDGSGRSSNGIKIVSSHYESSTPSQDESSDDNLLDDGYEIVTDTEINQLTH